MPIAHDDPGLTPERVALDWSRTAVSTALLAMLLLRWASTFGPQVILLAGVLLAMSLLGYVVQRHRYRTQARGMRDDAVPANASGVVAATFSYLVFGVASIVFVLLPS